METTYTFKSTPEEPKYLIVNCLDIKNLSIGIRSKYHGLMQNPMHIFEKDDFIVLSKVYMEEIGMPMIYMAEYSEDGDCHISVSPFPDLEYEFIMRATCDHKRYMDLKNE